MRTRFCDLIDRPVSSTFSVLKKKVGSETLHKGGGRSPFEALLPFEAFEASKPPFDLSTPSPLPPTRTNPSRGGLRVVSGLSPGDPKGGALKGLRREPFWLKTALLSRVRLFGFGQCPFCISSSRSHFGSKVSFRGASCFFRPQSRFFMGRNRRWVLEDKIQQAVWQTMLRGLRPPSNRWTKSHPFATQNAQKNTKAPEVKAMKHPGQTSTPPRVSFPPEEAQEAARSGWPFAHAPTTPKFHTSTPEDAPPSAHRGYMQWVFRATCSQSQPNRLHQVREGEETRATPVERMFARVFQESRCLCRVQRVPESHERGSVGICSI